MPDNADDHDQGRYVVSIRTAGLGDQLICLGAAWCFARSTGRTLVADWRRSWYGPVRTQNAFPLCFEPPSDLAGVPFIGLHLRHGNNGEIMGHAPYWELFEGALERCERAVRLARDRHGKHVPVLLCTDSPEVQQAVLRRMPGVVARAKGFRPPGEGELHLSRESHRWRDDALVEMLLLADASALIRYPPGSFYTYYAAAMRHRHDPPPETVEEAQRPHDPEDPLGPALLF